MLGINMLYDILADVIEMELVIAAKIGDDCQTAEDCAIFESEFRPRMQKLSETYAALKGKPEINLDI